MVRTTPNAVAQKRKTTDAAEMIEGAGAGRVTVRTCAGEADQAAATAAELRRARPENGARYGDMAVLVRSGRWQGDRAEPAGGAGPESRARLLGTTVQPLPHTPDGPHDDGEVEEDEGGQDADPVPVKTQPSQCPAVGEQRPEHHPDDDGRQDEGHRDDGSQDPPPRQGQPIERMGDRDPDEHSDHRGGR